MHGLTTDTEQLARQALEHFLKRQRQNPWPLGGFAQPGTLENLIGESITPHGLGCQEAFRRWVEILEPATVASDHPRYLAFISHAPTEASTIFDLLISTAAIYGGSRLEASGAVYAENEALRWLADLAGFPPAAGGAFVPSGTLGNLSALHAARQTALARRNGQRPTRWQLAASSEAHSSVIQAARVLDVDVITIPVDSGHRLTAVNLRNTLESIDTSGLFAVVTSAGSTNLGLIDDLPGIGGFCHERDLWMHVDGAYGLAALASPARRALFAGIERADSFIVDPHKWLFAPYDSCALVYRNPELARAAHTQSADYLEVLNARDEWNPADYALHLTRRARGLPFWFSLVAHGAGAYVAAIETTLSVTRQSAEAIRARSYLELAMEPELTVLVFRRNGWLEADYGAWSDRLLRSGTAFVIATRLNGEPIARLVIVNPRTTITDIELILDSME